MIKVGLLPLYIELYDEFWPHLKNRLKSYYNDIAKKIRNLGYDVEESDFCRVKKEFENSIKAFNDSGCTAIITLHMAYSPSLESADILINTDLPVIVLDSTMTFDFNSTVDSEEIIYNHGIHGVMDMCSMLKRGGKEYAIVAGHMDDKRVLKRLSGYINAAVASRALKDMNIGIVGKSFEGMGDFFISDDKLKKDFGVNIIHAVPEKLKEHLNSVSDNIIEKEIASDLEKFEFVDYNYEQYKKIIKNSLALRKWCTQENLSGLTVNFKDIDSKSGLEIMPFLELSKAMARGLGYAGEGDTLTAAFCAALSKAYKETSFIEIFCPDWKGNCLMLSHMGEYNIALSKSKPVIAVSDFVFSDADKTAAAYGCFKDGKATFINISITQDGYKLIVAPVDMLQEKEDNNNFKLKVRGWMKPQCNISDFLEKLSYNGATHHSILIYGEQTENLIFFSKLLGTAIEIL